MAKAPLLPLGSSIDRVAAYEELAAYLRRTHPLTDRDRVEAAIAKLKTGKPLTAEESAELARIGALSDRGYVTLSAGVAVTVTKTNGTYQKYGGELNSDRGAIGVGEMGYEQRFAGSGRVPGVNLKAAGKGDSDGAANATGSAEVDVARYGPARGKVGYEQGLNGSSSAYAKGAVEQELPALGGGNVKPEAYVKVAANKLNETEQLAIDARMTKNTSDFRELSDQKRAALDAMQVRRAAALAAPVAKKPEPPPMVGPMIPNGGWGDTGT